MNNKSNRNKSIINKFKEYNKDNDVEELISFNNEKNKNSTIRTKDVVNKSLNKIKNNSFKPRNNRNNNNNNNVINNNNNDNNNNNGIKKNDVTIIENNIEIDDDEALKIINTNNILVDNSHTRENNVNKQDDIYKQSSMGTLRKSVDFNKVRKIKSPLEFNNTIIHETKKSSLASKREKYKNIKSIKNTTIEIFDENEGNRKRIKRRKKY